MATSFFLHILLSFFATAASKHSIGVLETSDDWHYLERFCFMSEVGNLQYDLQYPAAGVLTNVASHICQTDLDQNFTLQKLYFYYDSPSQWPAVYGRDMTCNEKEANLSISNNQLLYLGLDNIDPHGEPVCRAIVRNNNETWLQCNGSRRFSTQRDRWWFLALGNCNSSKGLYVEYDLTFTNGEPNQVWFYQFSVDEFYILPTDLAFLLVEIIVLVCGITVALMLRARQLFHQTYKLFLISLLFENANLIFDCAAYGRYAQDGIEMPLIKLFGQLFRAAGTVMFLCLLILLTTGYTITRDCVSKTTKWMLLVLMTSFILTYCALFIWQIRIFDPADVTYMFESYPGYILIGLRILAWLWFCCAVCIALSRYPEKRIFYLAILTTYTLWFWLGAVSVIIANHVLHDWMREKVMNGVENAITFYGFVVFLLLTPLLATNSYFQQEQQTEQNSDRIPRQHFLRNISQIYREKILNNWKKSAKIDPHSSYASNGHKPSASDID